MLGGRSVCGAVLVWFATSAIVAAGPTPRLDSVSEAGTVLVPAERGARVTLADVAWPSPEVIEVGRSRHGRPLTAVHRRGSLAADRTVVVVGVIHGDETYGRLVTDQLLTATLPADLDLWVVPTMNPDGEALGTHKNAAGVNLNRNWPAHWDSESFYTTGKYYSGPAPASEPETRAMMAFFDAIDPDVTVWYHSPWNRLDCNAVRIGSLCDTFAAAVGSFSDFADRPGTATDWLMTAGHGISFLHEFGSSAPSAATVRRHVDALLALQV